MIALAFPGQGVDWKPVLQVLEENPEHPLVSAVAERLGTRHWNELDPLDTRHSQPLTYVSGLVGARAQERQQVGLVMGHSLGELTACAWAGAVEPRAGLEAVIARASLGHHGQSTRPGAMAAFMRIDATKLEDIRQQTLAARHGELVTAVTNSPTQHVLSGDADLVDTAVARANDGGAVARRLPIGGAYHSPLMKPALERFRPVVEAAVSADPTVPVVLSTAGAALTTRREVTEGLIAALVRPVDWPRAVSVASGLGVDEAVDAGPGNTLLRLARFLEVKISWS